MDNTANNNPVSNVKGDNYIDNEIILYQPDSTLTLDVRVENETVWLNRNQMAILFDRDVKTIGKHINNALKEELEGLSVIAKFATTATDGKTYQVEYYNIEVITSVGYRVKSKRGVQFRSWANKVLKEYLLRGYSVNQRLLHMESRIDHRLSEHDRRLDDLSEKVDFFVRTSLPPKEGVVFDGQIFDAHVLVSKLIKQAKARVILIDNYIDETILTLLDKRDAGVKATIYTEKISDQLKLDIRRHNRQYEPIDVKESRRKIHDRFLIIDDVLYLIGASVKDLGRKLFAFSEMGMSPDTILHGI
ncbi:MAG: virulence RhuM family protein [Muribaculaceae bacterium]|nr:virulence RhuM family protein [Muribaculaceae bacterium]